MDMRSYLTEIEHATKQTIDAVWHDHNELEKLKIKQQRSHAEMEDGYRRSEFIAMNAIDAYDDMEATAAHWGTYFGADKEHHSVSKKVGQSTSLIVVRTFSTAAQSATLLQYGKQGISYVHQELSNCPPGRMVGTQPLRDVIWQGRNHGLHWEVGQPHPPVQRCFDRLAADFDPLFSEYR